MAILPHRNRDWQWLFSWEVLTIFEPRLLDLERKLLDAVLLPPQELRAVFCNVRVQVTVLLGWSSGRRHPVLRTSAAYHAALAYLIAIVERRGDLR